MDQTPSTYGTGEPAQPPRARTNWHAFAIGAMVIAFLLVVWQRDRIRAHWWVTRIGQTDDLERRVEYVIYLAGLGDVARGAVRRLARHSDPEIAGLAVAASSGLSDNHRAYLLAWLLYIDDEYTRYEAARALAFMEAPIAGARLVRLANASDAKAAAAALAGLARLERPDVMSAICQAIHHAEPSARAQAAESLGEQIRAMDATALDKAASEDCDPIETLVTALEDAGSFTGQLALEHEIATVSAAVMSQHGLELDAQSSSEIGGLPSDRTRTVAAVAAKVLSDLTSRPISPQSEMNESDRRQLIEQCRKWIASRRTEPS